MPNNDFVVHFLVNPVPESPNYLTVIKERKSPMPPFEPCPDCLTARDDSETCLACPVTKALKLGSNRRVEVLPPNQDGVVKTIYDARLVEPPAPEPEPVPVTATPEPPDLIRIELARIADALEFRNRPLRWAGEVLDVVNRASIAVGKFVQEVLGG